MERHDRKGEGGGQVKRPSAQAHIVPILRDVVGRELQAVESAQAGDHRVDNSLQLRRRPKPISEARVESRLIFGAVEFGEAVEHVVKPN